LAQQLIVDFVAELAGRFELREPIVEFGSLQVEPEQPSDLRPLFAGRRFIGTDIRPGPGVDRVEDLRALSFGDGEVGTALCLDTLEHCDDPLLACRELQRVLADGGVCIVSSVMFFPIHGYPSDYWRFTPEGLRVLLSGFDDVWVCGVGHPELPMQVVGLAAKARRLELDDGTLRTIREAQESWNRAEGKLRFGPLHVSPTMLARTVMRELPRAVVQRAGARLNGRA
jgi:SAM-dependent methyltransferase